MDMKENIEVEDKMQTVMLQVNGCKLAVDMFLRRMQKQQRICEEREFRAEMKSNCLIYIFITIAVLLTGCTKQPVIVQEHNAGTEEASQIESAMPVES